MTDHATLTWLHVSDLHFRDRSQDRADRSEMLRRLLIDISDRTRKDGFLPDFIFVTGDIAFSGTTKEYNLAAGFIDQLRRAVRALAPTDSVSEALAHERVFAVPGNHDITRGKVDLATSALHEKILAGPESYVASVLGAKPEIQSRATLFRKFANYASFVKRCVPTATVSSERPFYVHRTTLGPDQPNVVVLGLNTALKSERGTGPNGEEVAGSLVLSSYQVQEAFRLGDPQPRDFVIALMHHPLSWLAAWDNFSVRHVLAQQSDVLLTGHEHDSDIRVAKGPQRLLIQGAAGSTYAGSQYYRNAYALYRVTFEAESIPPSVVAVDVIGRTWNPQAVEWGPNRQLGETGRHTWRWVSSLGI